MRVKEFRSLRKVLALITLIAAGLVFTSQPAVADEYVMDTKKAHAFIQFKISHLGYSWLLGRFNDFEGSFIYDEKNPGASKAEVTIDTASIDSNHAERDKHLRGDEFLHVSKYPEARFESTSFEPKGNGKAILRGKFTLHGVTREIAIDIEQIGAGKDPWGGFRRGFEGHTTLALKDYGITKDLGPASATVDIFLSIEGIRQ